MEVIASAVMIVVVVVVAVVVVGIENYSNCMTLTLPLDYTYRRSGCMQRFCL